MWCCGLVGAVVMRLRYPDGYESYGPWAFPATLLIFGGLLALTVSAGLIRDRHVVRAVEFTTAQVRLESRAHVRTVPLANLRGVCVRHSGDTERGYQESSLGLHWRDGNRTIERRIVCVHDPALGQALARLLPSHVEVTDQWKELQEPDPS